jgi:alpha-tubulin suppressor-like RCC1 family protein
LSGISHAPVARPVSSSADLTTTAQSTSSLPTNISAVAVGLAHTCAIASGAVYCFGANDQGQLGVDPSTLAASAIPSRVPGMDNARLIAAGDHVTCVAFASSDTGLRCWGAYKGGAGNTIAPAAVSGLESASITALGASGAFVCAVVDARAVWCWGEQASTNSEAASAQTTAQVRYTTPEGLNNRIAQIAVGASHFCVLDTAGMVTCSGDNTSGQLGGVGRVESDPVSPTNLNTTSLPIASIAAANNFTCATRANGELICWGDLRKAVVFGDSNRAPAPFGSRESGVRISGLAVGPVSLCITLYDGDMHCAGLNDSGQLGDGTLRSRVRFEPVLTDIKPISHTMTRRLALTATHDKRA